jgi:hypothetical protein
MRSQIWTLGLVVAVVVLSSASAEPIGEPKGRFSMTPVEGGFIRLDTETGAVAMCAHKADTWACEPVNDRTIADDAKAKLEAENKALKDRLKSLEDQAASGKPPSDGPSGEPPGGISKLPTEEEVDKALDYVERMFKKFRDRAKKFEDQPATPTPKPRDGGSGAL